MNPSQATQAPAPQPPLRLLERPARPASAPPAAPVAPWLQRVADWLRSAG